MWKNANSFFTGVFTAVIIDSRLLKNSEGNRDCEWIFCRRREADVALFLQVTRMRKIVKICGTKQTKRIEIHQSRITTASQRRLGTECDIRNRRGRLGTRLESQIMTFWTRASKHVFPKRYAKMIDGRGKPKICKTHSAIQRVSL